MNYKGSDNMASENEIENLNNFYDEINDEINDEIENLKYLIENIEIENVNLIEIHYKIKRLTIKKDEIKTKLLEYNIIRND